MIRDKSRNSDPEGRSSSPKIDILKIKGEIVESPHQEFTIVLVLVDLPNNLVSNDPGQGSRRLKYTDLTPDR